MVAAVTRRRPAISLDPGRPSQGEEDGGGRSSSEMNLPVTSPGRWRFRRSRTRPEPKVDFSKGRKVHFRVGGKPRNSAGCLPDGSAGLQPLRGGGCN